MPDALSARSAYSARRACRDRWPASARWARRRRSEHRYPWCIMSEIGGSGPRQPSRQLGERLIGGIGALPRRRIDELVDQGAEVDHDLLLMLIVAVEHDADDIVLASADLLEHRRADERAAEVGTVGQKLGEIGRDLVAVVAGKNRCIDSRIRLR